MRAFLYGRGDMKYVEMTGTETAEGENFKINKYLVISGVN